MRRFGWTVSSLVLSVSCATGEPGAGAPDATAPAGDVGGLDLEAPGDGATAPKDELASGRRTVAADASLSCAIDSATEPGAVYCWGAHESMVLSMPAPLGAQPKRVEGIDDAVSLAVESDHVCAVRATGAVACWGFNHHSQLGLPKDEVFHPKAADVLGITDAVEVAVGNLHSCARLASGEVACWGMTGWGQLGAPVDDEVPASAAPVLAQGVSTAVKLDAAGGHTCALMADATVMCWGFNPFGEIGTGTAGDYPLPTTVGGIGPARDVALNGHGTWVLGVDGSVWYFGTHSSPDRILTPLLEQTVPGAVAIDGANDRACVALASGSVQCWAFWARERWGTGETNRASNELVTQPAGEHAIRELALGLTHTCGRDDAGHVVCWGQGALGQVGPGHAALDVPVLLTNTTHVAARHDGTCATAAGGGVWCFGENTGGRLGTQGASSTLPTRVDLSQLPGADADAQDLAVGPDFSCVVAGGRVFCWGQNDAGQLGSGAAAQAEVPGLSDIVRVAVGDRHACALRSDGAVACWGENELGQLGLGTFSASEGPSWVTLPAKATDVAAGGAHTCAAVEGQEAYCWGSGKYGQLGAEIPPDATLIEGEGPSAWQRLYSKTTPQKLPLTHVVRVAASADDTCAAHSTGVTCYGSTFDRAVGATRISGGDLSASRLVLSEWGGCRLGDAGAACLGSFEALGAGKAGDVLEGARAVALGSYACVVEANGDLRCYSDADVQVLAGTLDERLTPTVVELTD